MASTKAARVGEEYVTPLPSLDPASTKSSIGYGSTLISRSYPILSALFFSYPANFDLDLTQQGPEWIKSMLSSLP